MMPHEATQFGSVGDRHSVKTSAHPRGGPRCRTNSFSTAAAALIRKFLGQAGVGATSTFDAFTMKQEPVVLDHPGRRESPTASSRFDHFEADALKAFPIIF
jgi:hypothetical protein